MRYRVIHIICHSAISLGLLIFLVGCNKQENASEQQTPEEPLVAEQQTKAPKNLEPARKDMRVIDGDTLTVPITPNDRLERISPVVSAEEKNAEETARKEALLKPPEGPVQFPQPIVLSANTITSRDTTIFLGKIMGPKAEELCSSESGSWNCGNFSKAALQRFVRSRTLNCIGKWEKDRVYKGDCFIGGTSLSSWIVTLGWARTEDAELKPLMNAAKAAKTGLWKE